MKRVFVIDDHTAIREGYRAILERSGRYAVTGEAASAEEALEALAGAERPELFVVDVSLPGRGGLELCRDLSREAPEAGLVVASMHCRYEYMLGAFRAGASAYVSKDAGAEAFLAALDEVARGGVYLDPASLKVFVAEAARAQTNSPVGPGSALLSEREREVLSLFAAGKRAEEIAELLDLSTKTVDNHLSNITSKTGSRDRFELFKLAGEWKL